MRLLCLLTVIGVLAGAIQAAEALPKSARPFSAFTSAHSLPAPAQTTPTPPATRASVSPGPIIGLTCAFVASTIALGAAVGIRRRIDRVAGPPPDEEED